VKRTGYIAEFMHLPAKICGERGKRYDRDSFKKICLYVKKTRTEKKDDFGDRYVICWDLSGMRNADAENICKRNTENQCPVHHGVYKSVGSEA